MSAPVTETPNPNPGAVSAPGAGDSPGGAATPRGLLPGADLPGPDAPAIRALMREGYGTEDIMVRLGLPRAAVVAERDRLRALGRLDDIYMGRESIAPASEHDAASLRRWAEGARRRMIAEGCRQRCEPCPRCPCAIKLELKGTASRLLALCADPRCVKVRP